MASPMRYSSSPPPASHDRYALTPRDQPDCVVASCLTIDGAIDEARRCSRRLRVPIEVRDRSDRAHPLLRGLADEGRWMWRTPCDRCEGTGRAATDWSRKRVSCRSCAGTGYIFV
jgi:hypothetical protein